MLRATFLLLFFFLFKFHSFSQNTDSLKIAKRIYNTNPIQNGVAPIIDGVLDEAAWDLVAWTEDFIEKEPDENTPPSQQTKFKIIYDQKFLYVGFRCLDTEAEKIEKRLSRRDGFEGDWVEINLDTYHDKRTGFSFTITAAGVKGDEFISRNGNNWDGSWNPIWYTATTIDDEGWWAEIKIPLSQLKFGKSKEQIWGLQVTRRLFRKEERSVWQRVPQDAPGWVSEFGELHGLLNIEPQKQLEIQPFGVTQLDTYEAENGNSFRKGEDFKLNAGIDAKIGITNDLTLDLTVNPDFGQVEADPAAIALDGFQIFFEEQRPFFVENKNIFDYRFANNADNLFYSRRIGRSPQVDASTTDDDFEDIPKNSTILGAAKFSGKTKNGWSIGVLESVTSREIATVEDALGNRREAVVEPLTNYFVGRLQKDFNERNTYVGGIFTGVHRDLGDQLLIDLDNPISDESSELVGLRENNLEASLRQSAYTGGLDFRHNWKDRKYFIEGNFVASHVTGSKEAITETQTSITHLFQRPDASHVSVDSSRTSLTGTGGKLTAGKSGGGNWRYDGGLYWRSPELELNDIGFLRQADEIQQFANLRYLFLKPTKFYRRAEIALKQYSTFDFEGNYNFIRYHLFGFINYKNNWWTEVGFGHKPRIYSNTALRGGPRWRSSDDNYAFLFFGSDQRKKFNFTVGYEGSRAAHNDYTFDRFVVRLNYQPLDALSVSFNPELKINKDKTQYVTTEDFGEIPRYITGAIEQNTLSASFRINYTINPNLTIQYYGQPFISRGRYSNFNYVNSPVAKDLSDRIALYSPNQISTRDDEYAIDENRDGQEDYSFDNPDFAFVQFRSNLVLRWEYIPGSEVFLVWSQGVNGDGDANNELFRSLDNQILGQKPENTFVIKVTYRFIL